LLIGIYQLFSASPPSPEFEELLSQEKSLRLPKADERRASDEGCRWVSQESDEPGKKQWGCNRSISWTYNDNIKVAGQIRDRLVANGWREAHHAEYIGSTQQSEALSIDQISQGMTPKRASRSTYFFSPKPSAQGNLCVRMYINAPGDDRNPIKPSTYIELYGKSQGC
jgi:hypothetical protein